MTVARPGSFWVVTVLGLVGVALVVLAESLAAEPLYIATLYVPGIDKVLHFFQSGAICLIFFALLNRFKPGARMSLVVACGAALGAAVFDELQQRGTAMRTVEVADVLAGIGGISVAVALIAGARRPRLAFAAALCGLTMTSVVTYDSYLRMRDYNRGVIAEREGRPQEALRHYLQAVESNVDLPDAYNAAAWLMVESGEGSPQRAVKLAEQSLSMRPGHADTLDTYGWALRQAGRPADAVSFLEAALAARPDIYCIHYHLGVVYLDIGRRDDGLRHLRQQVERMPETREARMAADLLARVEQVKW
jgi:tetratricopeptide (TPR) repeat protein